MTRSNYFKCFNPLFYTRDNISTLLLLYTRKTLKVEIKMDLKHVVLR